ncbi:Hypothetical predicted protein [Olea europaea subsp. europaea]|uniref:PPPDE domain-containing protein n=1 Tax=Olea europaea subsp. europaea TaxID=158383 RepID=A0A8S0U7N9_OLEEU|nr:Hypothetical predicted protein [Olea europaea subsp. europaea]
MTEVILHVYDVTNSGSDKTNNTIMQINKIFKDGIGLGGIFHSAVQIYGDDEWSFGYCEQGSGVFSCPSTKNPMYTFRESIKLGETTFSTSKVNQILRELSREWPGHSYDLLSKNCNHFCDEFCERLGVPKLPGNCNLSVSFSVRMHNIDLLQICTLFDPKISSCSYIACLDICNINTFAFSWASLNIAL